MKNKKRTMLFVLLTGMTVQAQFSNTGTMAISPNTVMGAVSDLENKESGTLLNDGMLHIYSNFKNDGLYTFTAEENGNTAFRGISDQKIEGFGATEFQNILFDNSSSEFVIELHKNISVARQADFTQGILKNKDFGGSIVFERGATQINTNHDSHVDGKITKNGDEGFIFPVGHKGNFRHATITATNEILSSFTANYFFENSDVLYPHSDKVGAINFIDDQEYWVLEKEGGAANAVLTISWDEFTTTPDVIVEEPDDLHIVRWDEDKKVWVDEGGIVNENDKTVTTPISVSGYGIFTLAKGTRSGFGPCKKLIVYNAITPNGDGQNDYLRIEGLKACTDGGNSVRIFNRWGTKVYETKNYGENGNVFEGFANVKTVISGNQQLPSGTYFYVLELSAGEDPESMSMSKTGYLYIN